MGTWVFCFYMYVSVNNRSMVSYYVCCRMTCTYPTHIQYAILYKNNVSVVTVIGSLIYSSCYYILLL